MPLPISNYQEFFAEAKQAIIDYKKLREQEENLKDEEYRLDKAIESEEKSLSDNIAITIKKRSESIAETYDREMQISEDKLRKVKARREKAKNQGIKERIQEETMELRMANRDLKATVKSNFKKDSVPNICNTKLFYALYFPSRAGEFFKLLITFVICFIIIPISTYFLIPDHKQWYLIAIYIIAVIIFCGLYVMVGNHTKVKHLKALIEGRTIHNEILSNKRKIQARIKLINRDKNEDIYKLDTFDDEISHIKQDLTDISIKKQEALNTFETVTKNIISDELTNNVKVRMDKLIENHNLIKSQLDEVSVARKTKNLYIIDNYEVYIGKEFMSVDKIDALANIMNHSTVTNISEAIEEYRNKLDE